jgi:hypothetical protein
VSYVEIYGIHLTGDVLHYGEARNAHGCAWHIWDTLCQKYCGKRFSTLNNADDFWGLPESGLMSKSEDLVLVFTYDYHWFQRRDIPDLVQALQDFWGSHSKFTGWDGKVVSVAPTIPEVIRILNQASEDESLWGVCFNQTSVNSNPWVVREPKKPYSEAVKEDPGLIAEVYCARDEERRPFSFAKDTDLEQGRKPVDAGEFLRELWGSRKVVHGLPTP